MISVFRPRNKFLWIPGKLILKINENIFEFEEVSSNSQMSRRVIERIVLLEKNFFPVHDAHTLSEDLLADIQLFNN